MSRILKRAAFIFVIIYAVTMSVLAAALATTAPTPAPQQPVQQVERPTLVSLTDSAVDVVGSWVSNDTTYHVRQTIILNGDNTARLVVEYTDNARNTDFLKGWWAVKNGRLILYDTRASLDYPVSRTGDQLTIGVRTWTKLELPQ